jgi:hypothetical protein
MQFRTTPEGREAIFRGATQTRKHVSAFLRDVVDEWLEKNLQPEDGASVTPQGNSVLTGTSVLVPPPSRVKVEA